MLTDTDQLELDLSPLVEPEYAAGLTLAERFEVFHATNPHIADALERLAAQWLARHQKVGVKALAEQLRWRTGVETTGEPWKINNSHVAFYARVLIARRPEWADAIETRVQKAV
ncbi:hypothetical protein INN71_02545 [Nocardioides sp. ChNu-153]|uniref:hypothetical protein n=1 Tax=unclassified Nocardioides TaxID=2615069 RepID=UPI0024068849|nr:MULTISPECIES: hypothetical protein [unclassified Nocardioides]MDF9717633.1 hypothetical protein [Nocardioides sp. ChNu-99]MDN7120264.1 hypothetical protein [Nocardioides sp. ChNu-153]